MALAAAKTFVAAEVLFASDLNTLNTNILNNALSLISPLTGNLACGDNNLTGIGEFVFNDDGNATAVGRLRRNGNNLTWHDRTGAVALQALVGGGIFGLTMSNGTDAVNDIDIAVGVTVDDAEGTVLRRTATLTKQLDAAWAVGTNAGGLDTGAIANTTYHIFLIQRTDTGVVDALFSTSATAPTLPTSYTLQRRIGSVVRLAGTIRAFTQDGDYFMYAVGVLDASAANPGTSAVTRTLSLPTGINVWAIVNWTLNDSNNGNFGSDLLVSDLAYTDAAPSVTAAPGITLSFTGVSTAGANQPASQQVMTRTNTSGQVRTRVNASQATLTLYGTTLGYIDTRGRNV